MNKRVLITGAGGKLGSTLAKHFAQQGDNIILVDQSEKILSNLLVEMGSDVNCSTVVCDLGQEDSYVDEVREVCDKGLDVLINNAAFVGTTSLTGWAEDFENQSTEAWRKALEVNLVAPFRLSQLCASALRKAENGNIVNIASIYGLVGPVMDLYEGTSMKNPAAYGASKAGLLQLTQWLATTLAPNIRVNAVSPGGIERGQPESFIDKYSKRTPMQRMGREEDMIGAVDYLSSDQAKYVTGQNIIVDGGWCVW